MEMDLIQKKLLEEVADLHGIPEGAYNIRADGKLAGRSTTEHIDIVTKTDKPGIDIYIKDGTKNESVHIPVIIEQTGLNDMHAAGKPVPQREEVIRQQEKCSTCGGRMFIKK